MKGKIDKNGALCIGRPSGMVWQECPFAIGMTVKGTYCGQWCPLFGEPRDESGEDILLNVLREACKMSPISFTRIELCNKTLVFDEFTDERVGGEE